MSRTRTQAAIFDSLVKPVWGAYADKIPAREPSLAELINAHAFANGYWTPEDDGLDLDIADRIRATLQADYGLTDSQIDRLREAL